VAFANLQLRDVAILAPASQSAIAVSGTLNALRAGFGNATAATIATTARFYAVDSVLQARGQVVTSGDISLSNIIYSGASLVNRETEAPVVSVRNLRIPTVPNAFFLATDADGDVFAKDSNVNLGVATADDFRTLRGNLFQGLLNSQERPQRSVLELMDFHGILSTTWRRRKRVSFQAEPRQNQTISR
jgi:hypothetical protein